MKQKKLEQQVNQIKNKNKLLDKVGHEFVQLNHGLQKDFEKTIKKIRKVNA